MYTVNYENFSLKHYDEAPLSLNDAARAVRERQRKNPGKFHRIIPADEHGDAFYIESLSPITVYAQRLASMTRTLAKVFDR